jgi:chaperone modulatory protein CbpM
MIVDMPDFLRRARLDRETLEIWIEEQWLIPTRLARELAFSEMDLARAELIRDLTMDLGVNHEGVGVILNLVDQVHGLRRALADVLRSIPARSLPDNAGSSTGQDRNAP